MPTTHYHFSAALLLFAAASLSRLAAAQLPDDALGRLLQSAPPRPTDVTDKTKRAYSVDSVAELLETFDAAQIRCVAGSPHHHQHVEHDGHNHDHAELDGHNHEADSESIFQHYGFEALVNESQLSVSQDTVLKICPAVLYR